MADKYRDLLLQFLRYQNRITMAGIAVGEEEDIFYHLLDRDKKRAMVPWNNVESFDAFGELMIAYLSGELFQNPWMVGPTDPETVPLLEKLRHINAQGFVTLQGQPGICDEYQEQHGYIMGFLDKQKFGVAVFAQVLFDLGCMIQYYDYETDTVTLRCDRERWDPANIVNYDTSSCDDRFVLTRDSGMGPADSPEAVPELRRDYTRAQMGRFREVALDDGRVEDETNLSRVLRAHSVYIRVVNMIKCDLTLEDRVIEALERSSRL
jgi:hypothetical protein